MACGESETCGVAAALESRRAESEYSACANPAAYPGTLVERFLPKQFAKTIRNESSFALLVAAPYVSASSQPCSASVTGTGEAIVLPCAARARRGSGERGFMEQPVLCRKPNPPLV